MKLFHKHKYAIIQKIAVYDGPADKNENMPIYYKYVVQCVDCGKIKVKKI